MVLRCFLKKKNEKNDSRNSRKKVIIIKAQIDFARVIWTGGIYEEKVSGKDVGIVCQCSARKGFCGYKYPSLQFVNFHKNK